MKKFKWRYQYQVTKSNQELPNFKAEVNQDFQIVEWQVILLKGSLLSGCTTGQQEYFFFFFFLFVFFIFRVMPETLSLAIKFLQRGIQIISWKSWMRWLDIKHMIEDVLLGEKSDRSKWKRSAGNNTFNSKRKESKLDWILRQLCSWSYIG